MLNYLQRIHKCKISDEGSIASAATNYEKESELKERKEQKMDNIYAIIRSFVCYYMHE